jgi:hypothetical protein
MDYLLSREKLSCRSSNHCRLRSMMVNSKSVLRIYFSTSVDITISKLNLYESDVDRTYYGNVFGHVRSTRGKPSFLALFNF